MTFKEQIQKGIPTELPQPKPYDSNINHAPKSKEILSDEEKKLALKNALLCSGQKFTQDLYRNFLI